MSHIKRLYGSSAVFFMQTAEVFILNKQFFFERAFYSKQLHMSLVKQTL